MTKIEQATDYSGWIAYYGGRRLGKFPSCHVAKVACEIEAAVQSAKANGRLYRRIQLGEG